MKICQYCLKPAALLRVGETGYPYSWDYGPVWTCIGCSAWVGCHPGTENALGCLANAELRTAKQAAHAAFDPLWKKKMAKEKCSQSAARRAGYRWLAGEMGIPWKHTHIGEFNVDQCQQVVDICNAAKAKKASA